jgi:hypothetical protein
MSIEIHYVLRLLLLIHCALLLSACTSLTQQPSVKYISKESQSCSDFFVHLEQTISNAGVIDSEAARITAYPYLRVNRFLSDFRHDEMDETLFNAWVDRMQNLAIEGLNIELNNLSNLDREKLSLHTNGISSNTSLNETVRYCGDLLRTIDLDEDNERHYLKSIAKVADEYKTWQRVIGLYPLTALVFRSGIDAWHEETNDTYAQELESLSVHGELLRYVPPQKTSPLSSIEISRIIKDSSNNTFKLPEPSESDLQKLFDSFSPIFEVDVVTNDDQIGTVEWNKNGTPQINTDLAKVYQHLSYTRVSKQDLLQLNYTIWFPSRPKTSTFDMLGGNLDGITWRVTLLPNGKPWLFDTIHNCGCYHLFFPTQQATILPQTSILDEPVYIPQTLTTTSSNRQVIRIAHGTHYIERVYYKNTISNNMAYYKLTDSKSLRSLELNNGEYRSLYGQDGIIRYSKRGERYLFWPMGIPNPGAMRQWGHHATAFVGRRHFDDARLFEKYFAISTRH